MRSFPPSQSAKVKLPGPGVSIILLVLLVSLAGVSWIVGEKIAPAIFIPDWKANFEKGEKLEDTDPSEAINCMLKAIKEAEASHMDATSLANIYSKLGALYIKQGNRQTGDKYVNHAIIAVEKTKQYDKVAEFCQDASWAEHCRYWKDPNWRPRIEYEQKAMAAAIKTWGDKASEYHLWTLGQLYMDLGNLPKAQECIDRASRVQAGSHGQFKSYDYNCLSRLYALQHKWNKSLATYLKARNENREDKESTKLTDGSFQKSLDDANPDKSKYDFVIVRKRVQEKDFDQLDRIADKLRASQTVLPDGHWQLDKFYNALFYLYSTDAEEEWQTYLHNLSVWVAQKPQSITAKVALANAYVRYASKARGSGYPDTINQEGWDLMAQRLKKAEAQVEEAQKLSTKCPHLYSVRANIALGQQWSRADYEKMVAECQHNFPNYLPVYMSEAYYLQPRWNGISGECNDLITALADKAGGEKGDIIYAQMLWELDKLNIFDNIFSDNVTLDWSRVKRGLLALIKHYPHDTTIRKEMISLALQADDQKALKQAFIPPP